MKLGRADAQCHAVFWGCWSSRPRHRRRAAASGLLRKRFAPRSFRHRRPTRRSPQPRRRPPAVVAGGCFWGIEAVYDHVRGVKTAVSGYAGSAKETAHYQMVSTGRPVMPSPCRSRTTRRSSPTVSSSTYLFLVHDPTQLNRQGPDDGHGISIGDLRRGRRAGASARARTSRSSRRRARSGVGSSPTSRRSEGSTPRRRSHQNYAALHPDDPYISINDAPKVVALRKLFPSLYAAR